MSKPSCVVGIGTAPAAIDALVSLFAGLPADTGMAFVVVPSASPIPMGERASADVPVHLVEVLSKVTGMPASVASNGERLERDRVYVLRADGGAAFADGRIVLGGPGGSTPIDAFFRSLALGRRSRAIGVILAGAGSDGALGIQAIKEAGGITLVQDARSARLDAMPLAAIGTGCADVTLPLAALSAELGALAGRLSVARDQVSAAVPTIDDDHDDLQPIFAVLRAARDVDFGHYRHTTIKRRILRRMVLNKVASFGDYVAFLRERPREVEALYQDILIKVTHFFRDPEVFEALKRQVLPAIVGARRDGDPPVRIWVPGCATGEEVYSLAIVLAEVAAELRVKVPAQIFGTDLSEPALEAARRGVYLENVAMDVSPERLRRYFTREGSQYQIVKSLRDNCIFARHDLTRDPPFSRMDLVSCRNVLIYLEPALQARVVPMFHYALQAGRYLVLGASETVGGRSELFGLVDKKHKIYARRAAVSRAAVDVGAAPGAPDRAGEGQEARGPRGARTGAADAVREADGLVMDRYAPAGVIVDAELSIVQFRGHTGAYLEPAPGEASLNVLKMARRGLALELRAAIHKARRTDTPVRTAPIALEEEPPAPRATALRAGERTSKGRGREASARAPARKVAVEVVPLSARGTRLEDRWFLVLFHEHTDDAAAPARGVRRDGRADDARTVALERELAATKEYLQVTLEEHEATHEELQSANEELLSSNEELQSINEELERAKEEQEATNEELTTWNLEYRSRNAELDRLSNDLGNLLASVELPIVMLGKGLVVHRFTPPAERVLRLVPGDIGRPIGAIDLRVDVRDLEPLVSEVMETGQIRERDVRDRDGRRYSMRIRPYRTADDRIEGAVIVLVDIDRLRRDDVGDVAPASAG